MRQTCRGLRCSPVRESRRKMVRALFRLLLEGARPRLRGCRRGLWARAWTAGGSSTLPLLRRGSCSSACTCRAARGQAQVSEGCRQQVRHHGSPSTAMTIRSSEPAVADATPT